MTTSAPETLPVLACAHCGDDCPAEPLRLPAQPELGFCCAGCRAVYELLADNHLCAYYALDEEAPGRKMPAPDLPGRFDYLAAEAVQAQLLTFRSEQLARLTLQVPQMHCASCIWLLEHLGRLNPGVLEARVNFLRQEVAVSYDPRLTSLQAVVQLLAAVGYEPRITLAELGAQPHPPGRRLLYQLGVAGFCFGNTMLLAFPEYLAFTGELAAEFGRFFGYLSLGLSLPVLLFSARDFFRSARAGLRQRHINLDFPISLGLLALFSTSVGQVLGGQGPGFFDSFTGLVFFMLVGKWVQQRTYQALRFDRDFTSYFPVAVTRLRAGVAQSVSVKELRVGDRIRVRNHEVIPADAVLMRGQARIDYAFVSGESEPVPKGAGEVVYAGGRQVGEALELEVIREVSQGHLTQLWNNPAFRKEQAPSLETYADKVGRYFVAVTLVLAAGAALYWYPHSPALALRAATSVLVIACPCALSLATPFALGAALRVLGREKLYLKNAGVVELLGRVDTLVFDKTGTLTEPGRAAITYEGRPLTPAEQEAVAAVAGHSSHPLSLGLAHHFNRPARPVAEFAEVPGQGVTGVLAGVLVRLGSAAFAGGPQPPEPPAGTRVYVAVQGRPVGCFHFGAAYRAGLPELLRLLRPHYRLVVLSGDNAAAAAPLRQLLGPAAELHFHQSPLDKLTYVAELRRQGRQVLMVGDGLNDAGALRAAHVGVALTDTLTNFSPACDALLAAGQFGRLAAYLGFAQDCLQVVLATFVVSFCYNGIGLGLAVQGRFTPIVSAILMPLSSLSVMLFSTALVRYAAWRRGLGRAA